MKKREAKREGGELKLTDHSRTSAKDSKGRSGGDLLVTFLSPVMFGPHHAMNSGNVSRQGAVLHAGIHLILRKPARRARMASCLAFASPCLRMENCFRRTFPSSGLHDARRYFLQGLVRRSIVRCTPKSPDRPMRRTICEFQRRERRRGMPNFSRSFK